MTILYHLFIVLASFLSAYKLVRGTLCNLILARLLSRTLTKVHRVHIVENAILRQVHHLVLAEEILARIFLVQQQQVSPLSLLLRQHDLSFASLPSPAPIKIELARSSFRHVVGQGNHLRLLVLLLVMTLVHVARRLTLQRLIANHLLVLILVQMELHRVSRCQIVESKRRRVNNVPLDV